MTTLKPAAKTANQLLAEAFLAAAGIKPDAKLPLPTDSWEFCRLCVSTQDEHAKAKGLATYIRPLIADGDEYLRMIAEHVATEKAIRVEKSRQLRVTWLVCALLLHRVLTQPGARIAYQAKKWDDADAYLRDRFWFIYNNIPAKFAKPLARYKAGAIEVYHNVEMPTAQIQAVAQGAEQVRQFTFTVWWSDEFAFQADQDESLTAVKPSLDGGGQGIITSSAAGDQNAFYRIGHVPGAYGQGEKTVERLMEGVERWRLNGWTTLKVHYTADPAKRGQWAEQVRQGYSSQAWAQEQDIDFTVQPGKPVFCDTERIITDRQMYSPRLPLYSGFDYSYLANVCLTGQVRKRQDGKHGLHILAEVCCQETTIKPFRDKVLEDRASTFAGHAAGFTDYGDYAANQHTSTGVLIEEIRPIELVTVPTGPGGVRKGIEVIQYLISHGLLSVDPSCSGLIRVLRSAYVWSDKVDKTGSPIPSPEHPFADFADALRYLVVNLFELQDIPSGGQTVIPKIWSGDDWVPVERANWRENVFKGEKRESELQTVILGGYRGEDFAQKGNR